MSQPLTHSFPLLLPTVLLLLGIVFAGWVGWSVGVWVASLSATLIVLFLCRRHPKASNFLILTACFSWAPGFLPRLRLASIACCPRRRYAMRL